MKCWVDNCNGLITFFARWYRWCDVCQEGYESWDSITDLDKLRVVLDELGIKYWFNNTEEDKEKGYRRMVTRTGCRQMLMDEVHWLFDKKGKIVK